MLKAIAVLLLVLLASGIAWFAARALDLQFLIWFAGALAAMVVLAYAVYLGLRVKFVTNLPGYKWYETLHLMSFKMAFFDRSLNRNVRYARHALAIDERRADFDRVPWVSDGKPPNREIEEGAWWKQYWFAGNHSDIGGSYPETNPGCRTLRSGGWRERQRRRGLSSTTTICACSVDTQARSMTNAVSASNCSASSSSGGSKRGRWCRTQRFIHP